MRRPDRGTVSVCTASISAADQADDAAATASTAVTPLVLSSTAATRGPTSVASESSIPRTTFAPASS